MPTEDDLKRMFESADRAGVDFEPIDAKQVIRRSRARRLPKQLAAGAGGALAIVGITVLGLQSVQLGSPVSTADAPMVQEGDFESGGATDDSTLSMKRAPADRLNPCGGPLADVAPSQFGLVLDVVFPTSAPAAPGRIDGVVIMTNTGTEPVSGATYTAPALTLSQDGVVLWHTNGATDANAMVVDLAPGASLEYPAFFEPVQCRPEDEALEAFPTDLAPVGAGTYELSAAIDFAPDVPTATTELDLVTGPRTPIVLQ